MKLLVLNKMPILDQLHLEEALLREETGEWCLINWGSKPAVVMGISGKVDQLLHLERVKELEIPVIKRFSGGGTVVVDEETLFVTFIGDGKRFPEPLMRWTAQFYPLDLKENDLVLGERKFGGNAQYLRKNRWLHHTSFLWDYCPERMSCLQLPQRQPTYRAKRPHQDFIGRLKDHFDSKETFLEQVRQRLSSEFNVETVDAASLDLRLDQPRTHQLVI